MTLTPERLLTLVSSGTPKKGSKRSTSYSKMTTVEIQITKEGKDQTFTTKVSRYIELGMESQQRHPSLKTNAELMS